MKPANGHAAPEEELAPYAVIRKGMKYTVDHQPAWATAFLLGFQQFLIMFGPTFAIPVILSPSLCIADNPIAKGQLLNTMFFMCGIATVLQIFWGTRLPIIQSGSYIYFAVAAGIMAKTPCDPEYIVTKLNATSNESYNVTQTWDPNWHTRMAELQGNLMLASLTQIIIGGFGLVGLMLKVIGPLTITVLISLIGLCLAPVAASSASTHWGISILMVVLVTLFSEYLKNVPVPVPSYSFRKKQCGIKWPKLISTLSVILALIICWVLCAILTATNVFAEDSMARTDGLTAKLAEANWFWIPYPGQFGMPTVSIGGFVGMFAGVIGGVVESLGDYYACAKLSGAPPPPEYAMNRGILMEGVGCFLTGLCGPGVGVTSYSENIGAIGLTKVGSRRVIFCSAILMSVIGLIGKFGVFFASMPEPIIGGMYLIMFGIIAAVGIANLQFVDLSSSRNVFVLGLSLYMGLVIPGWINSNPKSIDTGVAAIDQLLLVLLGSGMIVGGALACFLDNTIPGTLEERGMLNYKQATENCSDIDLIRKVYHVPGTEWMVNKAPWLRKLPFIQK